MNDLITNKVTSIRRCIQRVRTAYIRISSLPFAEDYDKQDIVTLNLLRACEQAIDLANHIIKIQSLGMPQSSRESFRLLAEHKVISSKLAESLGNMTSFRNIALHRYQQLSLSVIENIIAGHLDDFEAFIQAILGQPSLFEDDSQETE